MSTMTGLPREHIYHAEATALLGDLDLPLVQKIKPQLYANLPGFGGYLSQHSSGYRLEGVISYREAHTQVSGHFDPKPEHGWNTVVTAVIEGLNVMEVVTADRVVAQISTDHPPIGYVPSVSFLGTRFENLRIAGHPVKFKLNLDLLGPKPADDKPYSSSPGFIETVAAQRNSVMGTSEVPPDICSRFNESSWDDTDISSVECSIVENAEGGYPGRSFGSVIDIPNFGRIYLGVLRLEQRKFEHGIPKETLIDLTMIELEMGCVASGTASIGNAKTNGTSNP